LPHWARADAPAAADFDRDIKPLLAQHCVRCHGPEKSESDFRIDTLERDFATPRSATHWTEMMDRINTGEMPPKDEPRPPADQLARVAEWIGQQLTEAEAARQAATGEKMSFRKLTREEYKNTIRDLLGVTFDASDPSGLPEDPDWQGFERIGTVLSLSATHIEKYLAAAETVLGEALALGPQPKSETICWTAADMRVRGDVRAELAAKGILDKVRADIVPNNGALDARDLDIKTNGEYIVRVKCSGMGPKEGRAARLRLYATDIGRPLLEQDVETPEDAPITIEVRAHLPPGKHLIRIVNAVPGPNPEDRPSRPTATKPFFNVRNRQPWQIKLTDEEYKPIWPTLLVDYVEFEGPVQASWPPPAHERLFFAGEGATKDTAYAREILTRFATQAFRRPLAPEEVDRLVAVAENAQRLGESFESSVKTAMVAVLCSSNFLYLVEGSVDRPSSTLNDWELASRLSYFLWSTMPDDRLRELAAQGTLHQPDVLRGEVRRMMQDPKILSFAASFPRQWLQLRRVGMFEPDKKIYPEYDEYLEKSMVGETTGFFREVLQQNLSLREFLDSDWTLLNRRLAGHYGIAGVEGEQLVRVPLKPDDHRGGLLTQASILGLTSDGTRHRPVHRRRMWPPSNPPRRARKRSRYGKRSNSIAATPPVTPAIAKSIPWAWPSNSTTPSGTGGPKKPCGTARAKTPGSTPAASCPMEENSPTRPN